MQIAGKRWQIYLLFAGMIIMGIAAGSRQMHQWLAVDATPVIPEERKETDLPPRVALTFDDGPHPSCTEKLLNGLRERGVKATFFVVGKNISGREEVIRQMWADGHLIGNHTWDHVDVSRLSTEAACEQLEQTSALVQEITGEATAYVRAPFGNWNEGLESETSMISVKWTVDPLDWTTKNVHQIVNKVVANVTDSAIILLHDYYDSSVEAALKIVDILQEQGFEFVTVEELLLE